MSGNPMDDVSNYMASGWRRDLKHIISCYWADQVGPLISREWKTGIARFLTAMGKRKDCEWLDIKELFPHRFMSYVAGLFWDIPSRDIKGLGDYMGWVGAEGYYHWKLVQLGQLDTCPRLKGRPVLMGPQP